MATVDYLGRDTMNKFKWAVDCKIRNSQMSVYQACKEVLEEMECPKCGGLGYYDDAEPGDISFNTFKCDECNQTGFKPQE